jgi:hypothetical protein
MLGLNLTLAYKILHISVQERIEASVGHLQILKTSAVFQSFWQAFYLVGHENDLFETVTKADLARKCRQIALGQVDLLNVMQIAHVWYEQTNFIATQIQMSYRHAKPYGQWYVS